MYGNLLVFKVSASVLRLNRDHRGNDPNADTCSEVPLSEITGLLADEMTRWQSGIQGDKQRWLVHRKAQEQTQTN